MQPKQKQSEVAETATETPRKSANPHHVMPGLIPLIAQEFTMPRAFRTIDAVKDRQRVPTRMIISALLHDLYGKRAEDKKQIDALEALVERALTVRQFNGIRRVA